MYKSEGLYAHWFCSSRTVDCIEVVLLCGEVSIGPGRWAERMERVCSRTHCLVMVIMLPDVVSHNGSVACDR